MIYDDHQGCDEQCLVLSRSYNNHGMEHKVCDSDCTGSEENLPPSENNQRRLVISYRDSLCTMSV